MRYTTLIDISEYTSLYRNHHARLVYLHMVLKSGWHDTDRDILDMSIRRIAYGTGLTISATRHALEVLQKAQLVTRQGPVWNVKKWTIQDQVTPRPKKNAPKAVVQRAQEQAELDARLNKQRAEREALQRAGKTPFMEYYESLIEKAKNGDLDAQKAVERHRATYEAQVKIMKEKTRK